MKEPVRRVSFYELTPIRSVWDSELKCWFYSMADIVGAISYSRNPRNYWKNIKRVLKDNGKWEDRFCTRMSLRSGDNKRYMTDVANAFNVRKILRLARLRNRLVFVNWLNDIDMDKPSAVSEKLGM